MARAYGANASLLAAFESTYGSTPVERLLEAAFCIRPHSATAGADSQRPSIGLGS